MTPLQEIKRDRLESNTISCEKLKDKKIKLEKILFQSSISDNKLIETLKKLRKTEEGILYLKRKIREDD